MGMKALSLAALAFGEGLCIYAEMLAARKHNWQWAFLLAALAGLPLVAGYHYGYRAFGSMWVVMVISVLSILVIEPIMVFTMFKEPITIGASLGFMFACIGFYFALGLGY
jgi:hypothetical protein